MTIQTTKLETCDIKDIINNIITEAHYEIDGVKHESDGVNHNIDGANHVKGSHTFDGANHVKWRESQYVLSCLT